MITNRYIGYLCLPIVAVWLKERKHVEAQEGRVSGREASAHPQDLPRVHGGLQPQGGREAGRQGWRW